MAGSRRANSLHRWTRRGGRSAPASAGSKGFADPTLTSSLRPLATVHGLGRCPGWIEGKRMAINRSVDRSPVSVAEAHLARVAADGSSRHRYLTALLEASTLNPARDLAD